MRPNYLTACATVAFSLLIALVASTTSTAATVGDSIRDGVFDTGQRAQQGEVFFKQHSLFLYFTGTVGVSDNLELELGATPGPFMAHARARVGLTSPDAPLQLVLGSGLAILNDLGDRAVFVPFTSLTIAHDFGAIDVHASVQAHAPKATRFDAVTEAHLGFQWQPTKRFAVVGTLANVAVFETTMCGSQRHPAPCRSLSRQSISQLGVKALLGKKKSTELELLLIYFHNVVVVPTLSLTHRY